MRNLGLPGMIGALGACFGRVVTLDSPKARPPGTFNWQATLWHELTHVVTLQLSKQRVPRWLTEGISEYEEQRARPEWGRPMQVQFAEAMDRGEVVPLAELNAAFSDPQRITLASTRRPWWWSTFCCSRHGSAGCCGLRRRGDRIVIAESSAAADWLQETFTAFVEKRFAPLRAALAAPEDVDLTAETSLQAIRAVAAAYQAAIRCRWRWRKCSRLAVTARVRWAPTKRPMRWRR